MNNGVNNTNTNNLNENTPTLAPMAGVKIAPAEEGPVDASKNKATTQQTQTSIQQPVQASITPTPVMPQPVQAPAAPTPVVQQPAQVPVASTPVMQQTVQATNVQPQTTSANVQKVGVLSIAEAQQKAYETPTLTPLPNSVVTQNEQPQQTVNQPIVNLPQPKEKKKGISPAILIIFILISGFLIYYLNTNNQKQIAQLRYNCTPITASKEEIKLDVNSTLVQSLYNRFATTIREDLAQPNYNDEWKIYMAYRQILETEKYDSNCNLFSPTAMEPYSCQGNNNFIPKAFKEETLIQRMKELYGENVNIPLRNIQLGQTCFIGYQYIKERGEFVEGQCSQKTATSFKADKKLTEAISTRNTIVLTEEVRYVETEGLTLPSYLKSGTYHYTFRLDLNYNYVLISKTYEEKY